MTKHRLNAVVAVVAVLYCFASAVVSYADQIKIGVSVPLIGSAATYGVDIKNALIFAGKHLGGDRYLLIFEDNGCNGKDAVTAAHKLIKIDQVKYVLGFGCSSALLSPAPLFNRERVITIGISTSSPELTNAGPYIFRTCPSDHAAIGPLSDYLKGKHKRLGALFEETDYAQDYRKAFEAHNASSGMTIVSENYLPEMTDFRSVLIKLKGRGVEGLFIVSQAEQALLQAVRQTHEMNWNAPVYNHVWAGSPTFIQNAGNLADGIIFSALPPIENMLNEEGRKLFEDYVKEFGDPKSGEFLFSTSYAAFYALHEALRSGQDVRTYLVSHSFRGVMAKDYFFDKNGDIQGIDFVLKIIKNGKPQILTSQNGETKH